MTGFLISTSLLAFYLAWNLGANDVANAMGTSVGSKAVTLKQALIIAGILELTGAMLFGQRVSGTLATQIVDPTLFTAHPQVLLVGMVAVLAACGVWLNVATLFGLPVSSSHAVVGAIAGFGWVAAGRQAVDWHSIGTISLTWVMTPIASGTISAIVYRLIQRWILNQPNPVEQLQDWIPWLSTALVAAFGVIVLPNFSQPIQQVVFDHFGLTIPSRLIPIAIGGIATVSLTASSWYQLHQETTPLVDPLHNSKLKTQNFSPCEAVFARFQLLSACCVAFAHGSNDVGNAIAPLAVISVIHTTGAVPSNPFQVPLWIVAVGGIGIVAGLAVMGKRVISTIGGQITPLQPSGGFCAELATATTVLMASQFGLPVSTSHALVGGVVGIGLAMDRRSVQLSTLRNIGLSWLVTIPVATGLGALLFQGLIRVPPWSAISLGGNL